MLSIPTHTLFILTNTVKQLSNKVSKTYNANIILLKINFMAHYMVFLFSFESYNQLTNLKKPTNKVAINSPTFLLKHYFTMKPVSALLLLVVYTQAAKFRVFAKSPSTHLDYLF